MAAGARSAIFLISHLESELLANDFHPFRGRDFMRVGIVRTASSACRCAESAAEGLEALGYESVFFDSEEIELQAAEVSENCDLVIDHTDTYRGRGLYRAVVRLLLEDAGASVVGSDARACFRADNKAAAKARLAQAGIPVPPGIVLQSKISSLPGWLKPPLILKPAFEHMSRGVRVALTAQEACDAANALLESAKQPVLVETFIQGRELAVSLIESAEGLQVLPVLEWGIGSGRTDVLTEEFKLMNPEDEEHRTLKADLPDSLNQELESLARRAFQALDLRDYARFDIRLSTGGCPYFLEANTTPSLEPLEAFAVSAQWAGLDYPALVDRMLAAALRRVSGKQFRHKEFFRILLPTGSIEMASGAGLSRPADSSIQLAHLLDVQPGERVLDIGCGSGLLSIAAAKLGAARVVASDLDSSALRAAGQNAARNNMADAIDFRAGSWYEFLDTGAGSPEPRERFDVIIATPPQTPGPRPFGPKYGGSDGTRNLFKVLDGIPDFLKPESGRLWMMAISLANPKKLWGRLQELFEDVQIVHQSARYFTADEYEAVERGLFDYFCSLRSSGIADFEDVAKDTFAFQNLYIRAARPRHL